MMIENEMVKPIIRVGNSAGVLLPRAWLHGKARVLLIEEKLNPEREIFDILSDYLGDIKSLAIVGSYARGEQTAESDVDVLAITHFTNSRIKLGKYDIILISEGKLKDALDDNILPLLPMLREAKPLINKEFIDRYSKEIVTKKNLSFHFETTKSAMSVVWADIELKREQGKKYVEDASAYSLILRLRELYIVECLLRNKKWSKREFLRLIKKVAGNIVAYNGYLRVKDNKKKGIASLLLEEAQRIYEYIIDGIKEQQRKWAEISK